MIFSFPLWKQDANFLKAVQAPTSQCGLQYPNCQTSQAIYQYMESLECESLFPPPDGLHKIETSCADLPVHLDLAISFHPVLEIEGYQMSLALLQRIVHPMLRDRQIHPEVIETLNV